jgi:hypothetical protein
MDPGCPGGRPACGSKQTTHVGATRRVERLSRRGRRLEDLGPWAAARAGRPGLRRRPGVRPPARARSPWRVFVFTRECDFGLLGDADGPTQRLRRARPRRSSARSTATMSPGSRCCASPRRPRRSARTASDRGARDRRVRS